jgi:hypothetical protein
VGVVVGMEYLVSLAMWGCKFFYFLRTRVGGDEMFCVPFGCGDEMCGD